MTRWLDTYDLEKEIPTSAGMYTLKVHVFMGKCNQITLSFPTDVPPEHRIYGFITIDNNKDISVYNTNFITSDINDGKPIKVKSSIELYMSLAQYKMIIATEALEALQTELLEYFGFTI